MAASKFTPEVRGALIECFAAGCSVPDAASSVGVNEKTVKGWLTRGRREAFGVYADFARAADEVRAEARARPEPGTEDQLRHEVWGAVRKGNTQAMKLYWEMLRAALAPEQEEEAADPLDALDELARRRAKHGA